MRSVLLPHAEEDVPLARELAAFLCDGVVNVQVFLDEDRLAPGESLVSKAPESLMADALVVIVVCNASAPAQWRPDEWEPALWTAPQQAGVTTAVLVAGPCRIPELLRRRDCFDALPDRLAAFRELKSWLSTSQTAPQKPAFPPASTPWFEKQEAELEELRLRLADRPGRFVSTGPAGGGTLPKRGARGGSAPMALSRAPGLRSGGKASLRGRTCARVVPDLLQLEPGGTGPKISLVQRDGRGRAVDVAFLSAGSSGALCYTELSAVLL